MKQPESPIRCLPIKKLVVSVAAAIATCALASPLANAQAAVDIVPLAQITVDADGDRIPDRTGQQVRIRATVLTDPFDVQPRPLVRTFVDDGTGGLMLQTSNPGLFDGISAGDIVEVSGQIQFYHGSAMVSPDQVTAVDTGSVPPPINLAVEDLVSERYEGRLIRVSGRLVNAQNVELADRTGAIRVRARLALLNEPQFKRNLYSGSLADVVGIASQYDPSAPHDSGYRIEMLTTSDLALRTDYRPYIWGLGILSLIGILWWRARGAVQREAYTRGLLEKVSSSQRALEYSEERMRIVANATSDVIWELDLNRNELTWLAGAKKMFQIVDDGPVSERTNHLEFVHPDDAQWVEESLAAALSEGRESWSAEYRVLRADGQVRFVSDRARILLDEKGSAVRAIGAIVDITEKHLADERERELQTKMQHTQRLESLGILSSGIAHDFNNILASIVGSADLIRESGSLEDEASLSMLDHVTNACERGVDLTGRLLTYAGRAPQEKKSVDINALVDDVVAIVGNVAPKGVTFSCELDDQAPCVDGDQAQLQQVIMNFFTNAVEALADGRGEVRVSTELSNIDSIDSYPIGSEFRPGRYVILEVQDTGEGIHPSEREKIFEPFYTTKASGRGLGLSAVVGIINAHGGCLFLDSAPGRGTTFTALLPAEAGTASAQKEPPATRVEAGDYGTVLIADDEESITNFVSKALDSLVREVDIVHDGKSALERITANPDRYELLVLDVSMPGLTGSEVFTRIRDEGVTTPVLFISGHGAYELAERFESEGHVDILTKPFRLETLRSRCASLLASAAAA